MKGFTLIESLVALVVLSIGMLGIAALFTQALSAGTTSQNRAQAVNLLSDISDRIRVNRLGQADYAGAAADGNCDPTGGSVTECTPTQMAAHDLFVWDQQVTQLLPGGDWEIEFNDATNPPTYEIEVTWQERSQEEPVDASLVIQVPTF